MIKLKVTQTPISGLVIIEPQIFSDTRGYFYESYNKNDYYDLGITDNFVQDNQSFSYKNVLRGLHFQTHNAQSKLVRVALGAVYDVAVDLRKNSHTFGQWYGVELSQENHKQFYIPKGFAHGFLVLSPTAVFQYKCSDYYNPAGESGIIWNDTDLNINWAQYADPHNIIISKKDKEHGTFKQYIDN